jgi:S1-C subfamily serine protease
MMNQGAYGQAAETRSTTKIVVVALLIGLVAGFSLTYYFFGSEISYLQSQQQALKKEVLALDRNQAALTKLVSVPVQPVTPISYKPPVNYSQLYSETVASVVMVQAVQTSVQLGIFGSITQQTPVLGSGFVVQYNGSYYVVTNYHVIANSTNVTVTFSNSDGYPATVIGSDRFSDLAVLKVDAPTYEFHPLNLGNSSELKVGQPVVAIGNPFGLASTFTIGVVSATDRVLDDPVAAPYSIAGVIQTTAAINPGNSGGPLLDLAGQVVGVTTAVIANSQGLGFAIPSVILARELPFLIANGTYDLHPYIGFSVVSMNVYLAEAMHINLTHGVLIEQVVAGGPASDAGLKGGVNQSTVLGEQVMLGGDIIVSANNTPIEDTNQLLSYIELNVLPGQIVVFTVFRNGVYLNIPVVVGRIPTS